VPANLLVTVIAYRALEHLAEWRVPPAECCNRVHAQAKAHQYVCARLLGL
jgi:hypothetical protein